ncbi:unknownprotein [Zostera marina]|uniref:Uncharacterized protein n=1 Tax=Zostera marina TaxID=29655 RepID=A0A0K9PNK3_ZOSMR|nr:unknownprotein [Zostera marina]
MAFFTTSSALSIAGGVHFGSPCINSTKIGALDGRRLQILYLRQPRLSDHRRKLLSVRAEYRDDGYNAGGDFAAGFILGGALFGTLAYIFAPQIRKSLLNENEDGFQRLKEPKYYGKRLEPEMTQHTLKERIGQLNSTIDNVSSRLKGDNKESFESMEAEAESEIESAL